MTNTYYCTSTLDDHATIETIEARNAAEALDFFEILIYDTLLENLLAEADQPVEIRSLEAWDMDDKARRTIKV